MAPRKRRLAATGVAALAVYALLWTAVAVGFEPLTVIDSAALDFFYRHTSTHPGRVVAWDVFCTVLGPTTFRLATVVLIIAALVRRNVRIAMFLMISVEFAGLVTEVAKAAADRPRPQTALVFAGATSFPSGHALGVLVAVLALLTVGLPVVRPSLRGWFVALGVIVVVAIGIGRVALSVHHPSDVVAGWCLGYAYFVFCLLTVSPSRPITQPDETPEVPDSGR